MSSHVMSPYQEARRAFYQQHPAFWSDLDGTEYALYEPHEMSIDLFSEIVRATRALGHIYERTASLLRQAPADTLTQLGIPAAAHNYARLVMPKLPVGLDGAFGDWTPDFVTVGRFDFTVVNGLPKMMEFNTDTPTFIVESFQMNDAVARHHGHIGINAHCERNLRSAFRKAIETGLEWTRDMRPHELSKAHVAFAAYLDHPEDGGTTRYLEKLFRDDQLRGEAIRSSVEDIRHLRITDEGLYTQDGTRIDVLYRLYPIEYFLDDVDPQSGKRIGELLLKLVVEKKLALINPPSAFLVQSKAVQAAIWGMMEAGGFFTHGESEQIRRWMLPTYLENRFEDAPHVVKAVLGREGDSTRIVLDDQVLSGADSYADQSVIYQAYAPLPRIRAVTGTGEQDLHAVYTCFYVDHNASAMGCRAGGPITNNNSFFVPLVIRS